MDRGTFSPDLAGGQGQDYILRMIEEFGVFLAKLTARILNREFSEAMKQIEAFYRENLALDAGLIHTFSDSALIALLLKNGELGAPQVLNLARVLLLDADLTSRPDAGHEDRMPIARVKYLLSFSLLMEIALRDGQSLNAQARTDLDSLAVKIADWELPATLAYKLYRYHEYKGRYGKAEDALFKLMDSGYPEVVSEGRMFYRRLSSLSDAELLQGNLPRAELQDGIKHFSGPEKS